MLRNAQPEEISYEDLDVKEVIGAGTLSNFLRSLPDLDIDLNLSRWFRWGQARISEQWAGRSKGSSSQSWAWLQRYSDKRSSRSQAVLVFASSQHRCTARRLSSAPKVLSCDGIRHWRLPKQSSLGQSKNPTRRSYRLGDSDRPWHELSPQWCAHLRYPSRLEKLQRSHKRVDRCQLTRENSEDHGLWTCSRSL